MKQIIEMIRQFFRNLFFSPGQKSTASTAQGSEAPPDTRSKFNLREELSAIAKDPRIGFTRIRQEGKTEGQEYRNNPERIQETDRLSNTIDRKHRDVYERGTSYYQKCTREIRKKLDLLLHHFRQILNSGKDGEFKEPFQKIDDAREEMKNEVARRKKGLEESVDRVAETETDLEKFIDANPITPDHENDLTELLGGYPYTKEKEQATRKKAWNYLLWTLLAESVVNGIAFTLTGQTAIDSWGYAIILSLVNIFGFGLGIWLTWRYNKYSTGTQSSWAIATLLLCLVAFVINLGAAHFRDALEMGANRLRAECGSIMIPDGVTNIVSLEMAAEAAFQCLLPHNFLALHGLISYLFLLIGIWVVAFSVTKWENLIPGYPKFKPVWLKKEESGPNLEAAEEKAKEALKKIYDKYFALLTLETGKKATRLRELRAELVTECIEWQKVYPETRSHCEQMMREYHGGLLEGWRTHPDPIPCPERWGKPWDCAWEPPKIEGCPETGTGETDREGQPINPLIRGEGLPPKYIEAIEKAKKKLGEMYRFYMDVVDNIVKLNET